MKIKILGSLVLLFLALSVSAQEGADQMGMDGTKGVEGVFQNGIQQYNQIVVGDNIYALSKTMVIDGEKRLADQVLRRLERSERVRLHLSGKERGGYPVVSKIETNP